MTGKEMLDEFDLLYDAATEEAAGLDMYEKSMFLTKGLYEVTELRFDEYINRASRGFHDDELNRDALKGFISSAVVELQETPTISSAKAAAESEMSAGKVIDKHSYDKYKIENTVPNSYFFQRPSDSMGVLHEDVILIPKVKTKKESGNLVANVTPIRYDHIDRLLKNPFMKPRRDLTFRLNHSNYDGTSMSEIICDDAYVASQYRLKYVKRPYPIILTDLEAEYPDEVISIEGETLPYFEDKYESEIRSMAVSLQSTKYREAYDEFYTKYEQEEHNRWIIKCDEAFSECSLACAPADTDCIVECEMNKNECLIGINKLANDRAVAQALRLYPEVYDLSFTDIKKYIINVTADSTDSKDIRMLAKLFRFLSISQATNIDITIHHDIVQRGVELAILHYRENTLQNNMQAKLKQ